MRIISGKYKGLKLENIDGVSIRPTSDRLKETIFNVLAHNYKESILGTVWDLCAGSGALGLEALSRGAKHVVFVDKNVNYIDKNIKKMKLGEGYSILRENILSFNLKNEPSLVFLDPPYNEFEITINVLKNIKNNITPETILVVETDNKQDLNNIEGYQVIDFRKVRHSIAWFLKLA